GERHGLIAQCRQAERSALTTQLADGMVRAGVPNWSGAVAITREEIEREKKALPFGWGRFGKAYDQLSEISETDEALLAAGWRSNRSRGYWRFSRLSWPVVCRCNRYASLESPLG